MPTTERPLARERKLPKARERTTLEMNGIRAACCPLSLEKRAHGLPRRRYSPTRAGRSHSLGEIPRTLLRIVLATRVDRGASGVEPAFDSQSLQPF
jgi:ribosomal protein L13E